MVTKNSIKKKRIFQTKKGQKGFMMCLVAGSLITLLILLVSMLHNSYLSSERVIADQQPLLYAKFFFENVFIDVNEIVGPDVRINEQNNSVIITISDALPKSNFTSNLESYRNYLQTDFSSLINANVSANFSAIEDGTLELFLSADMYNNSYVGNNEVLFGTIDPDAKTNIVAYEINMTTYRYRKSIQDFSWDDDGDINVTIIYNDRNGTWQNSGMLDSDKTNMFIITFISNVTRTVEVTLGKVDQREGALWIKDTNSSVVFSFLAKMPITNASTPVSYEYNAVLNYSQINITKNGLVGN